MINWIVENWYILPCAIIGWNLNAIIRFIGQMINRHPVPSFAVIFVVAFGIAGSLDYQDAKLQEKVICKQNPKPHWCDKE